MWKLLAQLMIMILLVVGGFGSSRRAEAQQFDPRATLSTLISAFQNCGPPQAYQLLSPQLYQLIWMQTNGMGCYPQIRAAGPVQGMQIVGQQQFPIGPLFAIRVRHQMTTVDWFIGMNQFTGRVEYLNFQQAQGGTPPPDIETGPRPGGSGGGVPTPPGTGDGDDGCTLYPSMCER